MMVLYGAGGHGSVVLDTLHDSGHQVRGIFDDALAGGQFCGTPVLGQYDPTRFPDDKLIITIGENKDRQHVSIKIKHTYGVVVSKSSIISQSAKLGAGSMVFHHVIVQAFTDIGKHVILNTGSKVDHNCKIQDFAHLAPGVVLCGDVSIGEGTLVGAGAVVIPGKRIGKWATIGAGAVIIDDIPDYATVVGNPGRIIKK